MTAALLACAIGCTLFIFSGTSWAMFGGRINKLGMALDKPAALILTDALSALPRDVVKAPIFRDLLTQDLVFYYEDQEDRLNLRGTLKRLAFEHPGTLKDQVSDWLVDAALDEPAELAFWLDGKNAPRHWALAMTRGKLARALQVLSTWATDDKQLSLIGKVQLKSPSVTVPVYALTLTDRRTLAIASLGSRVVVLSDPGLLFDDERKADPRAVKVLAQLLSAETSRPSPWRTYFGLAERLPGHTLVAGSALLAMGWQDFFPSMKAIRIDIGPGGTTLNTGIRQSGTWSPAPWVATPAQPAACVSLPVDWSRAQTVLTPNKFNSLGPAANFLPLVQQVDGAAAVCWYARSQLHTPLWVAHATGAAPNAATLKAFMRWWLPERAKLSRVAKSSVDGVAGVGGQARIQGAWGRTKEDDEAAYAPSLRRVGDWWMFSPDAGLVALAADTVAKRYPSVADMIGPARDAQTVSAPIAIAVPSAIAEMAKRETLAVLTPQQQDFKQAIERQLWPRLVALARQNAVQAVPVGAPDAQGWIGLEWQAMKTAK